MARFHHNAPFELWGDKLSAENESGDGRVIISVDGACRNNNDPHRTRTASYGIYFNRESESNTSCIIHEESITNQRAEIYAAIKAVDICRAILDARENGQHMKSIIIQSDSVYLVDAMTSWIHKWRVNGYRNSKRRLVQNRDLFHELDMKISVLECHGVYVNFHHVYREENWEADRLANSALDEELARAIDVKNDVDIASFQRTVFVGTVFIR